MPKRKSNKPSAQQRIARERIALLFRLAKEAFSEDKKRAHRYAQLARRISLKYKVKIPVVLKRKQCKHCHSFLVLGKNLRVRTKEGHIVYTCMECGKMMRFLYRK